MKFILTGGAGFIGSCVLKTLNDLGYTEIIVVDNLTAQKQLNIKDKKYLSYYDKNDFLNVLDSINGVDCIIHLGACSSTTETDKNYLWRNNLEYSKSMYNYAKKVGAQFIYASSAATYGNGEMGFNDDILPENLHPLNLYGESKNEFDKWVLKAQKPNNQVVGLKFFNVYGPNEYHKTGMYSMVYQGYNQAVKNGKIKLFKGDNDNLNGEQKRDFIYVKDVCKVITWFINNSNISGIFNVGTGTANSFNDLANGVFKALNISSEIEYIDMPKNLIGKYQSYTVANITKLKSVGYNEKFYSLNDGICDYISNYLIKNENY